jgi:preprotein translocase subunit SecA
MSRSSRKDEDDEVYRTFEEKVRGVIREIKEASKRPADAGRHHLDRSKMLRRKASRDRLLRPSWSRSTPPPAGKPSNHFAVLNARFHEQEAYIVAQAGKPGVITIATNMAGRGTDIQLGGNAEMRIKHDLGDMPEGPERDAEEEDHPRRGRRLQAARAQGRRPLHRRHRAP